MGVVEPKDRGFVWGQPADGIDLHDLFAQQLSPPGAEEAQSFRTRLATSLRARHTQLVTSAQTEMGVSIEDAQEMVDSAVLVLEQLSTTMSPLPQVLTAKGGNRRIKLVRAPWGTVLAVLPQSAFLALGLTCMVGALASGNRIVLRIPKGTAGTGSLLIEALQESGPCPWVSAISGEAPEILAAFLQSPEPGIVHYFGSSGRIANLMSQCFEAGKGCIADGEGNTWAYVAADADPEAAANLLSAGSTRYGGQTCTSVNGAYVHPAIFEAVRNLLRASLEGSAPDGRALLTENPSEEFMGEGFFGPGLWIQEGDEKKFLSAWRRNRFPLCAAILGRSVDSTAWAARLPNLARLVINGDPSLEDPLEPWGGYPSSGDNDVKPWADKYTRVVQIDKPEGA